MKKVISLIILLAAVISCNRNDIPQSELISLSTVATKATPAGEWPCMVVMHRSVALDKIGTDGYKPYYETWLPSIDTYSPSNQKWNTQTAYPSNYDYVTMSGFAPAMQDDHGDRVDFTDPTGWLLDMCNDYKSIRVNYGEEPYDNSVWAGIANAGPKVGSSISPYKNAEDALDFHYATFRVKFQAICSENMKSLGVMDAKVVIGPEYIPVSLEWDPEAGSYYPKGNSTLVPRFEALLEPPVANDVNSIPHAPGDEYAETDYIYLCKSDNSHALPSLHINLDLTYSRDLERYAEGSRFPGKFGTLFGGNDVSVELSTPNGDPVTSILPGQSYVVTIVFDQDSFTLKGQSEDWEDGGNVIIPIPNPVPTT